MQVLQLYIYICVCVYYVTRMSIYCLNEELPYRTWEFSFVIISSSEKSKKFSHSQKLFFWITVGVHLCYVTAEQKYRFHVVSAFFTNWETFWGNLLTIKRVCDALDEWIELVMEVIAEILQWSHYSISISTDFFAIFCFKQSKHEFSLDLNIARLWFKETTN